MDGTEPAAGLAPGATAERVRTARPTGSPPRRIGQPFFAANDFMNDASASQPDFGNAL